MQNKPIYFSLLVLFLTFGGKLAGQTDSTSTCEIIPKIHLDSFIHHYRRGYGQRLKASVEMAPKGWNHFTVGVEYSRNFWDRYIRKGDNRTVYGINRAHSIGLYGRFYPGWLLANWGRRYSGFYGQVKCWYDWQRWWYPTSERTIRQYNQPSWTGDLSLGYQFRLGRSVVIDPSLTMGYGMKKYLYSGWSRAFHFDASLRLGWVIPVKK